MYFNKNWDLIKIFQTEYEFILPKGYVDDDGNLHRNGIMRLATSADEILPQNDPRAQQNPAYLTIILLSRVITRLGDLDNVNPSIIEDLFASDLAFLQEFYSRINGHSLTKIEGPELFPYQLELLQKEIDEIQGKISDYDDTSFKIKGWAVTIWSGIVVWGISQKSPEILFISIIAILGFWILDTYFKIYQRRSMFRMGKIELFLNNINPYEKNGLKEAFQQGMINVQEFPIHDPIGNKTKEIKINGEKIFIKNYEEKTDFWWCFKLRNIYIIYIALILGALILSILIKLGTF